MNVVIHEKYEDESTEQSSVFVDKDKHLQYWSTSKFVKLNDGFCVVFFYSWQTIQYFFLSDISFKATNVNRIVGRERVRGSPK